MQNRPRHPAELAADVIENVLVTEGDNYLVTPEHEYTWWQLSLLDVKAFLLAVVLLVLGCVALVVRWIAKLLASKSSWLSSWISVNGQKRKAA